MRWTVYHYRGAWKSIYDRCDGDTQDTLDRRLDFLQEKGTACDRPITAPLDDGIFELRAKDARMLFYFGEERALYFVHGIIKKRGKVPREDIDLARKRRAEIQLTKVKKNALPN